MAGSIEGLNPTRRYKGFRPRQAARGTILFTTGSSFPTGGLYNNSKQSHLLVVRDWNHQETANDTQTKGIAYIQGQPGTLGGTVAPVMPGQGNIAGQMWYYDAPSAYTPDFWLSTGNISVGVAMWEHNFPLAILPPGWSLALASASGFGNVNIAAMWEIILPEELDFIDY